MESGWKWAQVPQETRAPAPKSDVSAKEGEGLLLIDYAFPCAYLYALYSPTPPMPRGGRGGRSPF